ncbi:hypothetical protein ALC57_02584 [Trachymyrmex cornetzi]|uniref:Gustatory receptor n=1 Tax=Trachymyrmex cornetzi TaxID=471704 RepID=A0A151JNV8_9HYME|nr:hypothetical protein ALC57_02584 [Trachymyrmex cornetzi]
MTETLERALAPLLTFSPFFGLGMFEYPRGQPRPYLSCLYALAKWGVLMYFYYSPKINKDFQSKNYLMNDFLPLILIISIFIGFCRFKVKINETVTILYKLSNYNLDEDLREQILQFILQIKQREVKFGLGHFHFGYNVICWELKMCLHELAIVDDTLEALGTPKEYQRLRNWMIRIIIGWIAYVFFHLAHWNIDQLILSFYGAYTYFSFFDPFLFYYPSNIIILNALISAAILGLVLYLRIYTFTLCVSSRFHRINERLRVLYSDLFESNTDYRRQNRSICVHQRIKEAKDHNQYIWIIMHVHLQLCHISRKLNIVFKVQMLMQMIWYFSISIDKCILMFHFLAKHDIEWTFRISVLHLSDYFTFVLHSILFLILNYVCQTVYYKINEIVTILYKFSNYNLDEDLREQVNNYNKVSALCVILLALKIWTPI